MPHGVEPGAKMRINIPGTDTKVLLRVPEGAVAGQTISFKLNPSALAASSAAPGPVSEAERAAINIQAMIRGKRARGAKGGGVQAVAGDGVPEVAVQLFQLF